VERAWPIRDPEIGDGAATAVAIALVLAERARGERARPRPAQASAWTAVAREAALRELPEPRERVR